MGLDAPAISRSYRGGDLDDDDISLVEETRVPEETHWPTASI